MKTTLQFLTGLLFAFTIANTNGQTIPNSGFENWSWIGGWFENPDSWNTNNSQITTPVVKDNNSYQGNFSLQINRTGYSGYARSKFPFSQHPSSVEAYVKSTISGVDTVSIHISVYSAGNIVDIGDWTNSTSIPNWTLISIPVSVSFSAVDTLEIIITGGNQTGTSISVDELSYSLTNGINESNQNNNFSIFPNPFSSQTVLQTDNLLHNATLTVDNCFGQTVAQIKNIYGQTVTLQRNALPAGLYFIRLTEDNKQIATKKIIITD